MLVQRHGRRRLRLRCPLPFPPPHASGQLLEAVTSPSPHHPPLALETKTLQLRGAADQSCYLAVVLFHELDQRGLAEMDCLSISLHHLSLSLFLSRLLRWQLRMRVLSV